MDKQKILDSWLEYIGLESFSKAKIDAGDIDARVYLNFEGGQRDRGVILTLTDKNREIINNNNPDFRINKNRYGIDTNELYLFFPIIKIREEKREYLAPLFCLEITGLKDALYKNEKIDLNLFKKNDNLVPIPSVFSRVFNIDLDQKVAQNISLHELIVKEFLKKDVAKYSFDDGFREFKEFLAKSISDEFKNTAKVDMINDAIAHYEADSSDFTASLAEELDILKRVDIDGSLLDTYLKSESAVEIGEINRTKNTLTDKIWYGSFDPKYPLSKGQACVMQDSSSIVAVQGAPGTGKTTLFLSVIASKVVEKALKNIDGELFNNQILITSTSNKAVDNVVERFTGGKEFEGINDFYFIGGRSELMQKAKGRVKEYIEELKNKEYDNKRHKELEKSILSIKKEMDQKNSDFFETKKDIKEFGFTIDGLIESCEKTKEIIDSHPLSKYDIKTLKIVRDTLQEIDKIFELGDLNLKDASKKIANIKDELEITINSINKIPFYRFEFFGKPRKKVLDSFVSFTELKFRVAPDINALDLFRSRVEKLASELLKEELAEHSVKLSDLNEIEFIESKKSFVAKAENYLKKIEYLAPYNYSYGDWFRINSVEQNNLLYQYALEYNRLTALQNRKRVIANLEYWIDNILGYKRDKKKNLPDLNQFFNDISLVYPVFTSTLASSANFFKNIFYKFTIGSEEKVVDCIDEIKPLNLILSDESGMAPLHTIAPLMYKSENALIVGDPLQLEPVIALKDAEKVSYEERYSGYKNFKKYSVLEVSAYHRSAGCLSGDSFDIGDGVVLDEHRRCQEDIADMFIDLAKYKGVLIKTEPLKTRAEIEREIINCTDANKKENLNQKLKDATAFETYYSTNNIAINVIGTNLDNVNREEIKEIENVLDELADAGYDLKTDVGIITPYANQEWQLIQKFRNRLNHSYTRASIGTVHKFQGVEFRVIIFSTVLTGNMSSGFINDKPNLLNVAISRAKEKFILVGNIGKLKKSGSYLETMCSHIEKTGVILDAKSTASRLEGKDQSITITNNYSIIGNYETRDAILFTFDHLEKFESLLENAEKSVVIIVPWIHYSDKSNKKSIQYELIKKAKDRGVDITIIAGYLGTERDEDGNSSQLIDKYRELLGEKMLFKMRKNSKIVHTHEKILLVDDKVLVVGSFNWLSHDYYRAYNEKNSNKLLARRETSILTTNREIIERLKLSL